MADSTRPESSRLDATRSYQVEAAIYNTLAAVCDVTGEITAEPIESG